MAGSEWNNFCQPAVRVQMTSHTVGARAIAA